MKDEEIREPDSPTETGTQESNISDDCADTDSEAPSNAEDKIPTTENAVTAESENAENADNTNVKSNTGENEAAAARVEKSDENTDTGSAGTESAESSDTESAESSDAEPTDAESAENSDAEPTDAESAENSDAEPTDAESAESSDAEPTGAESVPDFAEPGSDDSSASDFVESGAQSGGEKTRLSVSKKVWIAVGAAVIILAGIYFGGVIYYNGHFFKGTIIQGYDCSNMTPAEAEETIKDAVKDYTYTLIERGGQTEVITAADADLKLADMESLAEAKELQNPFLWLTDSSARSLPLEISVTLDEDKLYGVVSGLNCIAESKKNMEGVSKLLVYQADNTFAIPDDPNENIISLNTLFEKVKAGMYGMYTDMSLENEGCYVKKSEEDNVKAALDTLNNYVKTKVTYENGSESYTLDGSTIGTWLYMNDDYTVGINSYAVEEYVENLAGSYNTIGSARPFTTSSGSSITVSGGDYGWQVNTGAETDALLEIIPTGEETSREPIYRRTAAAHGESDIGDTYVEISISGQHVWYYRDGQLIVQSDMVSGDVSKGRGTPTGVYYLTYKERNATLKGEDYTTPVSYWMPFNGGIGLHDASWRSSFGGSIYNGNGSHGCVNLPSGVAATIYDTFQSGEPVVVY